MAFRLEFDTTNKIMRISADGLLSDSDLSDGYSALRECSTSYGPFSCIVDYTGVTEIAVSSNAVRDLARTAPTVPVGFLQINVAPKLAAFGLARMFQHLASESRPNLRVVHTMEEAYRLIGVESPSFSPIDYDFSKRA